MDVPLMALQQHFGDACRGAEVAVDLKRRMRAQQIRIDAALMVIKAFAIHDRKKIVQHLPCLVPVA